MSSLIVPICKIKNVKDHPNADRLDILKVLGWNCIVPKGEFKVGELVIFVPPDHLLPESVIRQFNVIYLKGKNGRVGAIKLRGEYSEGLVLPNTDGFEEGDNVAEFYEIKKWEHPTVARSKQQKVRGAKHRLYGGLFPKYTKIENVKNFPDILEPGEFVVITEKIHGTNFRVGNVPLQGGKPYKLLMKLFGRSHKLLIGSRNVIFDDWNAPTYYDMNVYTYVAKHYNLKELIPEDYTLYGEIYGATTTGKALQKGYRYSKTGPYVRFFDVAYKREYLNHVEAYHLLDRWELPRVPVLYGGKWSMDLISELGNQMSKIDEYTLMEGMVIRPIRERKHKHLGRVILKALSPAYLVQQGRTEAH